MRESNGRFAAGNTYGPGRSGPNKATRLRKALEDCVTEEDVREVMAALKELACQGNVRAIRTWLEFAIGRPKESVDVNVESNREAVVKMALRNLGFEHPASWKGDTKQ